MGKKSSKLKQESAQPSTSISTGAGSSNKKPNLVGFQDGNFYKIRNVGDNKYVQLSEDGEKFICSEESEDKLDLQLFKAISQSNGYRIMAKMQKTETPEVWDFISHQKLLLQKTQESDKFTQNWKSENVPGYNSQYLIQSGKDDKSQHCLKNMGVGNQIKLVKKDDETIGDKFTHWYLELHS